jgi:hypothetical protein
MERECMITEMFKGGTRYKQRTVISEYVHLLSDASISKIKAALTI